MKLGLATKLDNRNKTTPTKFGYGVMSAICDVIVIFPIHRQFGAIRKPGAGCIVCKTIV